MKLLEIKKAIRANECASWSQDVFHAHISALTLAKDAVRLDHDIKASFWPIFVTALGSVGSAFLTNVAVAKLFPKVGASVGIAVSAAFAVASAVAIGSMAVSWYKSRMNGWKTLAADYDEIIEKLEAIATRVRIANEQPPTRYANPYTGKVDEIRRQWDGNLDHPPPKKKFRGRE